MPRQTYIATYHILVLLISRQYVNVSLTCKMHVVTIVPIQNTFAMAIPVIRDESRLKPIVDFVNT